MSRPVSGQHSKPFLTYIYFGLYFKRFNFESLQETIHDKNHASVLLPCIINSLLGNKANIIHQPFSVLRPTVYLMHKKLCFRFSRTIPLFWHPKKIVSYRRCLTSSRLRETADYISFVSNLWTVCNFLNSKLFWLIERPECCSAAGN